MADNPMGYNYEDIVDPVDVKPEQNWSADPRMNPSQNFVLIGNIGQATPMDYETHITRDYASPVKWAQSDLEGDIVLSPDILDRSPGAQLIDLQGLSQKDDIAVPIRFQEVGGNSNYFRGYLREEPIQEDVKLEMESPRYMENLNIGKSYTISILPKAERNLN